MPLFKNFGCFGDAHEFGITQFEDFFVQQDWRTMWQSRRVVIFSILSKMFKVLLACIKRRGRVEKNRDKGERFMAKKATTKKKSAAKKTNAKKKSAKKTTAKKQSPTPKEKEQIPRYPY